ncbi:MAG: TIGR04100 family radical SAM protein [Thermoguttaceae bacterium]|nr:TIGR04100 family radical SAM protein [Thermoguttaceae bacterium]
MIKEKNFTYLVNKNIYVNLTNRCPCACLFCLRQKGVGVFGSGSLWLEHEPTVEEACRSLDKWNFEEFNEIVFCGYGEPTVRLDALLKIAVYIRSKSSIKIRINTNGLADLIWNEKTANKLAGLVDVVSISMNASNKEEYLRLTRSKFGIDSFEAVLQYAQDCTRYVSQVVMTIIEGVTSQQDQELCRKICEERGVQLKIRAYEK